MSTSRANMNFILIVLSITLVPSSGMSQSSIESRYARYVEGIMHSYDRDNNELLDKDELNGMRRPPKNADLDGDGLVSKFELIATVSGKQFAKPEEPNEPRKLVAVEIFSIVIPANVADYKQVTSFNGKSKHEVIDGFKALDSNHDKSISFLSCTAPVGQVTKISSGAQVPHVTSTSRNRQGQTSRNISYYDVGLSLDVKPKVASDGLVIETELQHSAVLKSKVAISETEDEKQFASFVLQFKLGSELRCSPDQATITTVSNSGYRWIIATFASQE